MACVCAWIVFACNAVFNLVVIDGLVLRLFVVELIVVGVRIALEDLVIKLQSLSKLFLTPTHHGCVRARSAGVSGFEQMPLP